MNSSTTANVRTSSTSAPSTSLRPRTKRLISGLSDVGAEETELPTAISPSPSPFASRSVSPIPAAHPQRSNSQHGTQRFAGSSWGRRAQLAAQGKGSAESPLSPTSLAGLWGTSWNTLQGLASDFLGNDVAGAESDARARQKKPYYGLYGGRSSSASRTREWGPSAPTSHPATGDVGSGTREEREAALRAQKRKDMLMQQDSSYADTLGKFKRRLSDDHESMSAPPGEDDNRAALVYLHHVHKADTLAGITIKYNISANALRKANRMWPNDTVQSRQTLVLPVDACGVKGRPVSDPSALDLLSSESEAMSAGQAEEVSTPKASLPNGQSSSRSRAGSLSTNTTSRRTSTSTAADADPPWHHDSWVILPHQEKPTEIARLSRRALGYFPPARRKSNCFTDEFSTPSVSLDLNREIHRDLSIAPGTLSPLRQEPTHPHEPSQSQQPSTSPRRHRRSSNASTGYFPTYMHGPGGVGTMKSNVHFPGPAQDGLNKMFAKHLPDVAPPKSETDLHHPSIPLYSDETPVGSGVVTPSYPDGRSGGVNLENVGGAIEGWVRRMASKAQTSMSPNGRVKAARASVGTPGRGAGGIGDLIEMTDEFEIGADEEDEEDRGRLGRPGIERSAGAIGASTADYFGKSAMKDRSRSGNWKAGKDD